MKLFKELINFVIIYFLLNIFFDNIFFWWNIVYSFLIFAYLIADYNTKKWFDKYVALSKLERELDHNTKKIYYMSKDSAFEEVYSRGYFIEGEWIPDPEMPLMFISFEEM